MKKAGVFFVEEMVGNVKKTAGIFRWVKRLKYGFFFFVFRLFDGARGRKTGG